MDHSHHQCEHASLAHCRHCNVVYCKSCKQEWSGTATWYWWQYPQSPTGWPYPYTVTSGGSTGGRTIDVSNVT
mgnify:FL=1